MPDASSFPPSLPLSPSPRSISIWDARKTGTTVATISDVGAYFLSLAWHPSDRDVLASGSRDRAVKVWSLRVPSRPRYVIQTSGSCGHVSWRPGRPFHIASTGSPMEFGVHVWDIREPNIPRGTLLGHTVRAAGAPSRSLAFLTYPFSFSLLPIHFSFIPSPARLSHAAMPTVPGRDSRDSRDHPRRTS